jgi:hypothetical protein
MLWLAIGAGILLLLLWLGHMFAAARVETIKKTAMWTGVGLGSALLILALFTGRGAQAIWTLVLFGPVIWRLLQSWRLARRFRRGGEAAEGAGGARAGAETAVETATLVMRLDHATGRMSGRVRRGALAGRELAELRLPELLARASVRTDGATVFGYYVKDPQAYGVVSFDSAGRAETIEEKPLAPRSNYAVTGLYFYDGDAVRLARELGPGKTIVTFLCDPGSRYASRLFNPEFLAARGLPVPPWLAPAGR